MQINEFKKNLEKSRFLFVGAVYIAILGVTNVVNCHAVQPAPISIQDMWSLSHYVSDKQG